ncbi:hypothetical protein ACFU7T_24050 [Streptomyces sp. NPDC057555]|uniref:hypothetical protein n=1 Tax=Streptomyces sp. NPDC057555 TaxID=3346166 RepID=UPI0036978224
MLADADEFPQYPVPRHDVIAQADRTGHTVVGGLMLDRVAAGGRLTSWKPEAGLDLAHPLGGHLTHRLLHGDPRKIVLAPLICRTGCPSASAGRVSSFLGGPVAWWQGGGGTPVLMIRRKGFAERVDGCLRHRDGALVTCDRRLRS